ncbi:hypothetical protein [Dactylosporangium darangshiense]|uniref:Lipoprotein n=1 Tax=Dactylosporangium darangshiense TaxID=579108 RepID=A0ABP8DV99_9ACTN
MLAVLAVAVFAVGACKGAPANSASPTTAASTGDAHTSWVSYVQCMRNNGHPDFPDPTQDSQGQWGVSVDTATVPTPACEDLLRTALRASRVKREPTAAEMARLRQYSQCVRDHDMPNYPDPGTDGVIDMPEGMRDDPKLGPALVACQQYAPPQEPK